MSAVNEIKTMKLYTHMERVYKELEELHLNDDSIDDNKNHDKRQLLDPVTLSSIDSLHYCGNQAIHNAIQAVGITASHVVCDIGSGLGGPARMLAHFTHCRVHAYELQADLHATAQVLTRRCGMEAQVSHLQGDFLQQDIRNGAYDTIVSWLAFLHIKDRTALFTKCAKILKQDGLMYVEDFILRANAHFSDDEQTLLAKEVYVVHPLPTLHVLEQELKNAGFCLVQVCDMTDTWTQFVNDRFAAYRANYARHERVHGPDVARDLSSFFGSMVQLFQAGHLGGVAYTARRQRQQEPSAVVAAVRVSPSSSSTASSSSCNNE